MALFGKSDAGNVPVLTAFYQAETQTQGGACVGSELDVLVFRVTSNQPDSMHTWASGEAPNDGEKYLCELADHHALICRLMDAAADKKNPSVTEQNAFYHLLKAKLSPPIVRWPDGAKQAGQSSWNPPKIVYHVSWNSWKDSYMNSDASFQDTNTSADFHMRIFLTDVLNEFLKGIENQSFTRCEECGSVFAATRKGQRFCSQRDVQRQAQRRARRRRAKSAVTLPA